jgi:hypothetical protein
MGGFKKIDSLLWLGELISKKLMLFCHGKAENFQKYPKKPKILTFSPSLFELCKILPRHPLNFTKS